MILLILLRPLLPAEDIYMSLKERITLNAPGNEWLFKVKKQRSQIRQAKGPAIYIRRKGNWEEEASRFETVISKS